MIDRIIKVIAPSAMMIDTAGLAAVKRKDRVKIMFNRNFKLSLRSIPETVECCRRRYFHPGPVPFKQTHRNLAPQRRDIIQTRAVTVRCPVGSPFSSHIHPCVPRPFQRGWLLWSKNEK